MISKLLLAQIDIQWLPPTLRRIAEKIGIEAALCLAESFPGEILRMPVGGHVEILRLLVDRHPEMDRVTLAQEIGVSVGFVDRVRSQSTVTGGDGLGVLEMVTVSQIVHAVCDVWQITEADIVSRSRTEDVVFARHVAMYIIRRLLPNLSLANIGHVLQRTHHTSILHGIRNVQNRMWIDKTLESQIEAVIESILEKHRP